MLVYPTEDLYTPSHVYSSRSAIEFPSSSTWRMLKLSCASGICDTEKRISQKEMTFVCHEMASTEEHRTSRTSAPARLYRRPRPPTLSLSLSHPIGFAIAQQIYLTQTDSLTASRRDRERERQRERETHLCCIWLPRPNMGGWAGTLSAGQTEATDGEQPLPSPSAAGGRGRVSVAAAAGCCACEALDVMATSWRQRGFCTLWLLKYPTVVTVD